MHPFLAAVVDNLLSFSQSASSRSIGQSSTKTENFMSELMHIYIHFLCNKVIGFNIVQLGNNWTVAGIGFCDSNIINE